MSDTDLQYTRLAEGTRIYTIDELYGMPSAKRAKVRRVKRPGGCEWFETCEGCKWADCESDGRGTYQTGRASRIALREAMLKAGATPAQADLFTGMRYTGPDSRAQDAVRRRRMGQGEGEVARSMGVSARTVRYWCQGAAGIKRHVEGKALANQALTLRAVEQARSLYSAVFSPVRTHAADNGGPGVVNHAVNP